MEAEVEQWKEIPDFQMQPEREKCEDMEKLKKRRSSILKTPKVRNAFEDIDITETCTDMSIAKPVRRVSFASSNFIKPFAADPEKNTIWDTTYEEDVNHTNSTQSSQEQINSTRFKSTMYNSTSVVVSNVTNARVEDMDVTKNLPSIIDKENIPIGPPKSISIVDFVKKRSASTIIPVFDLPLNAQTPAQTFEGFHNMANVTQSMEFTCQNVVPLMQNKENLFNYTMHQEVQMEFTGISLHEKKEKSAFDASAMELTCQVPVKKSKMDHTNVSQGDMEFTCQVPPSLLTKTGTNMELTCNETRAKMVDMEFTCQVPVDRAKILKTNVTNVLQDDMEFTCQVPQMLLSKTGAHNETCTKMNDDMEFTCQVPQMDFSKVDDKMEFTCQKSPLTETIDDMELTRHGAQNMTHASQMEMTCQVPYNNLPKENQNFVCQPNKEESSCQGPLQESFPMDVHMVTINQTPNVTVTDHKSYNSISNVNLLMTDRKLANNSQTVSYDKEETLNMSERKCVGFKDRSQTKDVLSKTDTVDILSNTNPNLTDGVNMNSLQTKSLNKEVAELNQTGALLSKTATEIDSTANLTLPQIGNVTKNATLNLSVSKVGIMEASQIKDKLSTTNANLVQSLTESMNMNSFQTKSLNKGVAELSQTGALLSKTATEIDRTTNLTIPQVGNVTKNATLNLSVSKVGIMEASQIKDKLSTTNANLVQSLTESMNMNSFQTKSLNKGVTELSQTGALLSKTATEIDSTANLTIPQIGNVTKNATLNLSVSKVGIMETSQIKDKLSTTNANLVQSLTESMNMNSFETKSLIKEVAEVSQTGALLKTSMEIDNTANLTLLEVDSVTLPVNSMRLEASQAASILSTTSNTRNLTFGPTSTNANETNAKVGARQTEDQMSKIDVKFDNTGNMSKQFETSCQPVTVQGDVSSQQKSECDMEIDEPLVVSKNVENSNAVNHNSTRMDGTGVKEAKDLVLQCSTTRAIDCNKSKPILENTLNGGDIKSNISGVESIDSKFSSDVAKIEKSFDQKENSVPNLKNIGGTSLNATHGASHRRLPLTPKSPKVTSIPIRANSTLLNTPERLSRFQLQKEEPDLDMTCPIPVGEATLGCLATPKREFLPLRSLEPSFHLNLTNISSGIDDTQHLLQCTYSKPVKEAKLDEMLEESKNSPDTSCFDVLQNRKLSNVNDTYVLKAKQGAPKAEDTIMESNDEEDTSFGLISDDRLDTAFEVEPTVNVKYELKPVRLKIKRGAEVSDLLGNIKRQRLEIKNLLENVKFRSFRIPTELTVYENSSLDHSELMKDLSEEVVSCPSMEDKIRKHQESSQNCWALEKVDEEFYQFSTLFGVLLLILQIDTASGNVYNIQTVKRLSGAAKPIARFSLKLLLDKLNHNVIKSAIGEQYDILSFLDYVQMSMLRINQFTNKFMISRLVKMEEDFVAKFTILNVPLVLSSEILVDVSELENLQYEKHVTVVTKIGKVNENEVKNLVQSCPKGIDFIANFEHKIQEFLKLKERRKGFERKHD